MKCDLLLIDGYNMIIRSKNKWSMDGSFDKVVLTFHQSLMKCLSLFESYRVVFFLDDYISNSFRKKIYPAYKSCRTFKSDIDDEFKIQKNKILKMLDYYPIDVFRYQGYEADDLIALICKNKSENVSCIVWTNDNDLIQVKQKSKNCEVWDPSSKCFLSAPPFDICVHKALIGDTSDCISGIKGIDSNIALKCVTSQIDFIKHIASNPVRYVKYRKNMDLIDLFNSKLEIPEEMVDILEEKKDINEKQMVDDLSNFGINVCRKDMRVLKKAIYYRKLSDNFFYNKNRKIMKG